MREMMFTIYKHIFTVPLFDGIPVFIKINISESQWAVRAVMQLIIPYIMYVAFVNWNPMHGY